MNEKNSFLFVWKVFSLLLLSAHKQHGDLSMQRLMRIDIYNFSFRSFLDEKKKERIPKFFYSKFYDHCVFLFFINEWCRRENTHTNTRARSNIFYGELELFFFTKFEH